MRFFCKSYNQISMSVPWNVKHSSYRDIVGIFYLLKFFSKQVPEWRTRKWSIKYFILFHFCVRMGKVKLLVEFHISVNVLCSFHSNVFLHSIYNAYILFACSTFNLYVRVTSTFLHSPNCILQPHSPPITKLVIQLVLRVQLTSDQFKVFSNYMTE